MIRDEPRASPTHKDDDDTLGQTLHDAVTVREKIPTGGRLSPLGGGVNELGSCGARQSQGESGNSGARASHGGLPLRGQGPTDG